MARDFSVEGESVLDRPGVPDMKNCTSKYLKLRSGRSFFSSAICVALLTLWLTHDCVAAPPIPPPPGLTLGPDEQAMLEALVDEAIAQEELARTRRQEKEAEKRLSSPMGHHDHHHDHHHDEYGPPPPLDYKTKAFSLWTFKKAILNALIQSIKAITGGVIALSGQLVKVKGHLVAAKGKILETKGDAITEFGKHLATKALLTPVHVSNYDHSSPGSSGSGVSSYSHPPTSHEGPYPPAIPPTSYGPPGHDSHGGHHVSHGHHGGHESHGHHGGHESHGHHGGHESHGHHGSHVSHAPHHAPPPSYGPPTHDSHSFVEYHGPPPSNYLPPTASFHSGAESWLNAAGHYGEPSLHGIHQESHHGLQHDLHHIQHELHHPIQKKEVPKGLQAGLIILKPVKEVDLADDTPYQMPKAFSKHPTLIEIQESKLKKKSV